MVAKTRASNSRGRSIIQEPFIQRRIFTNKRVIKVQRFLKQTKHVEGSENWFQGLLDAINEKGVILRDNIEAWRKSPKWLEVTKDIVGVEVGPPPLIYYGDPADTLIAFDSNRKLPVLSGASKSVDSDDTTISGSTITTFTEEELDTATNTEENEFAENLTKPEPTQFPDKQPAINFQDLSPTIPFKQEKIDVEDNKSDILFDLCKKPESELVQELLKTDSNITNLGPENLDLLGQVLTELEVYFRDVSTNQIDRMVNGTSTLDSGIDSEESGVMLPYVEDADQYANEWMGELKTFSHCVVNSPDPAEPNPYDSSPNTRFTFALQVPSHSDPSSLSEFGRNLIKFKRVIEDFDKLEIAYQEWLSVIPIIHLNQTLPELFQRLRSEIYSLETKRLSSCIYNN